MGIAFNVVMFLLTAISPAYAGVETLFTATVASLLTTAGVAAGTATIIAPWVAGALVIGGTVAANFLLSKTGGQQSIDPGKAKETFTSADSPELRAVGRVRLGGLKAYGNSTGTNRYRMILHCKGLVHAPEQFYIGGREVIVNTFDFSVSSPPWTSGGGVFIFIHWDLGIDNKDSWDQLHSNFPPLWTVNHRARGIAQSLITYVSPGLTTEKFAQLYQGGLQDLEMVWRGEATVHDPRTNSSDWSENGILNAFHILRTFPELSDLALYDLDLIASEADRADVATLRFDGSSTSRARCWGVWSSETSREDTMSQVLDSIGAWIIPRNEGTRIGLQLMDDDPAVEASIAVRDIIDMTWREGPEAVERPNVCRVSFYSQARNFDVAELDMTGIAWARVQNEIDINGEKPYDVKLPFCPDSGQAQQIARRKFALARADSGVVHTNFAGLKVLGCRVIEIEFPDDLGTFKCMVGVPRILDDQGQVEIPFSVWPDLQPWDPETDEAAPPDAIPDVPYGTPLDTPARPLSAAWLDGIGTGFAFTLPLAASPSIIEPTVRVKNGGLPGLWRTMAETTAINGTRYAHISEDLSGLDVEFRVRWFDNSNNGSSWSPTLSSIVAASAAPTGPGLIDNGTDLTATAPNDPWVASISIDGDDPLDVDPGGSVTGGSNSAGTHTAQAFAIDGTPGAITTLIIGGSPVFKVLLADGSSHLLLADGSSKLNKAA